MEAWAIVLVVVLLIGLPWGRRRLRMRKATNQVQKMQGPGPRYAVMGIGGACIAIAPATKKILFIDRKGSSRIYDFRNISDVQIYQNEITLTETKRLNQIIGALVGKFLFGPVGFEIGGRTGATTMIKTVNFVSLRIFLDDITTPMWEVELYRGRAVELTSRKYERAARAANEWLRRIKTAMTTP